MAIVFNRNIQPGLLNLMSTRSLISLPVFLLIYTFYKVIVNYLHRG